MRILIILGLVYLLYRVVKKKLGGQGAPLYHGSPGEIDDIMVKDPYCETHIPKRDSIRLRHQGTDYFFCSRECRDRFVALHDKKS